MNYLLFGGGLYMVLMAVFWYIQPARGALGAYFAAMYSSTGLIVLYAWAERTGYIYAAYPLYNIQIPLCYAFAPLLHYGFSQIAELHHRPASFRLAHFLPAIVSLPIVVANNLANADLFASLGAAASPQAFLTRPSFLAVHALGMGSNVYILYFLFKILAAGVVLLRDKELKTFKELRLCLAFVVWFILDILLMVVAHLMRARELLYAAKFSSSLTFIAYSFYSFRYPEYAQRVIRRSKQIRYRNTQLRGVDTDELLERLEYLMKAERLYSDMELTLISLSALLMVTPHQLSEIFNNRLKMNFRAYLNERRIKEAERLLVERPEASILDIAFDVGFSSKTSFNDNFLKATGIPPSDYRRQVGEKAPRGVRVAEELALPAK
jgi:AraC-like DNA-binding protein